jgi:hypothetical protein
LFGFRSNPSGDPTYYKFDNQGVVSENPYLRLSSGSGSFGTPFLMRWQSLPSGGGGTANSNLALNYYTSTLTLILSDPADNLPAISTTQVAPGRTVLIKDVILLTPPPPLSALLSLSLCRLAGGVGEVISLLPPAFVGFFLMALDKWL